MVRSRRGMLSAPVLRRKPHSKGNIGDGKRYANWAAFQAGKDAWEQEQKEHAERMAERKRTRDTIGSAIAATDSVAPIRRPTASV